MVERTIGTSSQVPLDHLGECFIKNALMESISGMTEICCPTRIWWNNCIDMPAAYDRVVTLQNY